jgi:hypothetical protein
MLFFAPHPVFVVGAKYLSVGKEMSTAIWVSSFSEIIWRQGEVLRAAGHRVSKVRSTEKQQLDVKNRRKKEARPSFTSDVSLRR